MKRLLIALGAALLAQAHAEPAQCPAVEWRPASSISELPNDVQLLLGRGNSGVGGIADASEPFSATDAIAPGAVLAMSRFRSAALSEDCVTAVVERGGIAHYFEVLVFRKEKLAWRLLGTRAPADEEMPQQQAKP